MTTRVSVVGANGRVGSALVQHLSDTHDVVAIVRGLGETPAEIAARAVEGADVVVNAAGVAHLEHPTPADLERLRVGNIDLPLALADAALRERAHLIHISSVKAMADATSEYGSSKFEADQRLESEFGDRFADAGLGLVIVRPLALLFPPLTTGRVARLRFLRHWPAWATPPVRLPVLAPQAFLDAVDDATEIARFGMPTHGVSFRDFGRFERGSLREVRQAHCEGWEERLSNSRSESDSAAGTTSVADMARSWISWARTGSRRLMRRLDLSGSMRRVGMAVRMIRGADGMSSRSTLSRYFATNGLRRSPLRHFVRPPGGLTFTLDGITWNLDPESSQLGGVHDVFLGHEYDAVPGYSADPEWTVVDAGANVGAYSLWQWRNMDGRGHIVAVEASPVTRDVLTANLERNRADGAVTIVGAAVWSSSGIVDFVTSERSSSTSGVRETLDTGLVENAEDRSVPAISLDDLLEHPALSSRIVDVLKLDVEGAEAVILRAASSDTLARIRRIVVETDERTWSDVREMLGDAGFTYEGLHRRVGFFSKPPV